MLTLDDLEARLQSLLEVRLLKYLPGFKTVDRVYGLLASAMRDYLKQVDGKLFAPNVYAINAHPSTLASWFSNPEILGDFSEALRVTGEEAGFHFLTNPTVITSSNLQLNVGTIQVIPSFTRMGINESKEIISKSRVSSPGENIPKHAFLIREGGNIVPLIHQVIGIGRGPDNQLVINNPQVSRAHAQIRAAKGNFVLFDLNSRGGTFVNHVRVSQAVLSPGDVISLAGETLIYGQDKPPRRKKLKVTTRLALSSAPEQQSSTMQNNKHSRILSEKKR